MRRNVLSSAGTQDMDTSGFEVSNLDDIEFFWENPQLQVDTVIRRWTGTLFRQKRVTI